MTSADNTQRSSTEIEQASLPRNVWVLTATSFFNDISSEMIVNLLPLFLANVLGVSAQIIGLIDGVAETTASLLKVFSGWLSDRLRMRKPLAVFGYSLSALTKPLLLAATGWPLVLVVRFLDRVGKGIRTAPRDALLSDSVNDKQRGRAFGLHRAGDTLGAALGIGITLLIVWLTGALEAKKLPPNTFYWAVLLSIIPTIFGLLILMLVGREVRPTAQRERPSLSLAGLDSRFRRLLPIVVLFALGNSSDSFLILRAQERGLPLAGILLTVMMFNVLYAGTSSTLGALSDRLGRRRVIIGGWLLYALIYLGFALASSVWHIVGLYILYGLYYAATEGVVKALIGDLVPSEQRGTAYGIYSAALGLAALPASIVAGWLWQNIGPATPFLLGAVLALLAVVWFSRETAYVQRS